MAKKQLNLEKNLVNEKKQEVVGLDKLMESVKRPESEEATVNMNFVVSERLRNAFKSKVSSQGKKIRDVLSAFMENYIKNND